MKYAFVIAITLIKRNIWNTFISIVSISLAMVIPAIFITQYFTAVNNYHQYMDVINLENTYVVSADINDLEEYNPNGTNEIEKLRKEVDFMKAIYPYHRIDQQILLYNDNFISGVEVRTVSPSNQRLYKENIIKQGSWLSKDNECMIGKKIADSYHIKIGDEFKVDTDQFKVSGIFDIPTQNECLFVNAAGVSNSTLLEVQYYIQTSEMNEKTTKSLKSYFIKNYQSFEIHNQTEYQLQLENRISRGWGISIILSMIAILYTILNIGIVQSLYENENRKNDAIISAIGANNMFLLLKDIFRAIILSFLSTILSSVILYAIQYFNLLSVIEMQLEIKMILIIWLLSFLVIVIFINRFWFQRE